jgi:small-conductance mechanosensitive channel
MSDLTKIFNKLVTLENLILFLFAGGMFLLCYFLHCQIRKRIDLKQTPYKYKPIEALFSKKRLWFILFSLVMLAAHGVSVTVGWKYNLFKILGILSFSWFFISYVTYLAQRSALSISFGLFIWFLSALSVFGYLDDFLLYSQKLSLPIGAVNISLFTVMSACIIFVVLFWIVSRLERIMIKTIHKSGRLSDTQKVLYSKVLRCSIWAAALFIGFRMIGVDLTSIAILSGAIGFGIGFGLQKIFSNLISGIILLLDKSINPGDVIALGDTYGVVKNLEARYVSIVTLDGKKHLIPNEQLVTEKVENWSYQDHQLRLTINVGVSYDSDPEEVRDLLLECAKSHPGVISSPAPACLFADFGDSALIFELRFWIDDLVGGIGNPTSEVRMAIWKKLKEHNISIPFPHREVVLRNQEDISPKPVRQKA